MTADVPFLLGEATASLYYQGAAGAAILSAPIWFGAIARDMVMSKSRQSFRQSSTGARGITTYQGNTTHRVSIGKAWVLPIQNGPDSRAIMTEFAPQRNQRFVLQLAWLDQQTSLTHQRIYYGLMFEGENLNSRGALDFTQRQTCSAEWMEQNPCGGQNPNLSFTVQVAIPEGQDYVNVTGLTLPFTPMTAVGYTTNAASGNVIWVTGTGSLSQGGGTFNLSSDPTDAYQILVATFYSYVPEL